MKKKVVSLSLASALALATLSGVAGAADPQTAEEKFNALMEAGIFEGFPDGEAHLDRNMTRAEASKIAVLILGLTPDPDAASGYKDLKDAEWSAGFIGAATKAGIVEGKGNGVFDPNAPVTIEQLAKIMVKGLGINTGYGDANVEGSASDWAKAYVEAALNAGLIAESDDYTSSANRQKLVETAYDANELNKQVESVREENKKSIAALLALDVMDAENGQFNGAENISKEDLVKIISVISNGKVDASGAELHDNPTFADILRFLLQSLGYPASALSDESTLVEKAIEVGILDEDNILVKAQLTDAPVKREWTALLAAGTAFNAGTVEVAEDGTVKINKDKHLSETMPVPDKPKQVNVTDIANLPKYDELKDIDPIFEKRGTTPAPSETPDVVSGDTTAPIITAATIKAGSNDIAATITNRGGNGVIELTSDVVYLKEATLTVNERATLTITDIEGINLESEDFAEGFFVQTLSSGENQFDLFTKLGTLDPQENGVSVSFLRTFERDNDNTITIKGKIRDSAGNSRDVTLDIVLPVELG